MAHPDPAVRSIQIASALLDRLGELLRPRPGAPLLSALAGREVAADELELRLGEAQQIAPEIWRHLDDARAVLGERGVDVAGYDEIRKQQNPALLATSNIEVKNRLDYYGLAQGAIRVITTKTVTWDSGNFASGIAGCALLKRALPEVEWEALERADREQIAAAGSLKTARWRGVAKWLAVATVIAGIAVGAHAFFTRGQADAETTRKHEDLALKEASARKVKAQLTALSAKYAEDPCDKDTMRKYTAYLFADGQKQAANDIETKFLADCPK